MAHLSRDDVDATHTLFVIDRPDGGQRFVFVEDRCGAVAAFTYSHVGPDLHLDGLPGGQVLTLSPDPTGETVTRTVGGVSMSVSLPGRERSCEIGTDGSRWTGTFEDDGAISITDASGHAALVVQPQILATSGGKGVYDIWIKSNTSVERAIQAIAEMLCLQLIAARRGVV